jgi:hypothetical protein
VQVAVAGAAHVEPALSTGGDAPSRAADELAAALGHRLDPWRAEGGMRVASCVACNRSAAVYADGARSGLALSMPCPKPVPVVRAAPRPPQEPEPAVLVEPAAPLEPVEPAPPPPPRRGRPPSALRVEMTCGFDGCAKVFSYVKHPAAQPRQFCSRSCRGAAWRKDRPAKPRGRPQTAARVEAVCEQCRVTFVYVQHPTTVPRKFCSGRCRNSAMRKPPGERKPKWRPPPKPDHLRKRWPSRQIDAVCPVCVRAFTYQERRCRPAEVKFCSNACRLRRFRVAKAAVRLVSLIARTDFALPGVLVRCVVLRVGDARVNLALFSCSCFAHEVEGDGHGSKPSPCVQHR